MGGRTGRGAIRFGGLRGVETVHYELGEVLELGSNWFLRPTGKAGIFG